MKPSRRTGRLLMPGLSLLLAVALSATAEPVAARELMHVPGPAGALEGEAILAKDARAGVVIVPGSGPTDRDGNGPAALHSDTYRLLAEGLAAQGVSTLRIDKRGFFGSRDAIADPEDVTIGNYAEDVRRWHAAFAERIGRDCVWIAGHSEGGLVALAAAAEPDFRPCGLILLATPGRRISDLMREQFRGNPANGPYLAELDRLIAGLEQGRPEPTETISEVLRPLFREGLQRYMIDLFRYDPAELARGMTLPVIVIQGERDMQVKPQDARLLAEAMPEATIKVMPGITHMLKADVPGAPFATYQDPRLPLGEDIVPAITDFIRASEDR